MMQERVAIIVRIRFPCPTTSNFEVVEEEEEVIETQLNTVRSFLHFQQYLLMEPDWKSSQQFVFSYR